MKEHYTDRERRTGRPMMTIEEVAERYGQYSVEEWSALVAEEPGVCYVDDDGFIIREVREQ